MESASNHHPPKKDTRKTGTAIIGGTTDKELKKEVSGNDEAQHNNNNIHDRRLAALRESRVNKPDYTHKERLEILQVTEPELWAGVDIKKFRKLIHKDNQARRREKSQPLPVGAFRVPVKPYAGCPYPCQLCGKPLRPEVYTWDNIIFCRPDGRPEPKSLRWALDNELYHEVHDKEKPTFLVACKGCFLPKPWGNAPPITSSSVSTDYKDEYAVYSDEDDDEEEYMYGVDEDFRMFGFSNDEAHDLLCQGVKPWDDDAHEVLAALQEAYRYY